MYDLVIGPKGLDPAVKLSLNQFSNTRTHKRPISVPYDEYQLRCMLMRYDTNGDGRLSKEELRAAFKSLGSRAPTLRAFFARSKADHNHDGFIDGDEFDSLVRYVMEIGYKVN